MQEREREREREAGIKSLTLCSRSCSLKPGCLPTLLAANRAGHQEESGSGLRDDLREAADSVESSQVFPEGPV